MLNAMDKIYFNHENFTQKTILNVFGYGRKSRGVGKDVKVDSAEILRKQRERIEKICEIHGWNLTYFEELGSGGLVSERQELVKMWDLIKKDPSKCDMVLTFDLDRLGRDDDMIPFYTLLRREEIYVGDSTEDKIFDLNNDTDKTFFDMKILYAGMELRKYKIRTKEHRVFAFQNGQWLGGVVPFPYVFNPTTKGLEVVEEYRELFWSIVEKFLNGWSYSALARLLDENKIPTPHTRKRKTKKWWDKSVQTILISEVHRGMLCQKGYKNPKGEYIKLDFEKWNINYEPKWETLISESLSNKIMAKYYENKKKSKKSANQIHSLSGLLYCGECGKRLTVFVKPNGDLAIRKCKGEENKKCSNAGGRADIVERDITELLENIVEQLEETGESFNDIDEKKSYYLKKIENIKIEIAKNEKQISNSTQMLREMWDIFTNEQKRLEQEAIKNLNENIIILKSDIQAFQEEIEELQKQEGLSSLERFKKLVEKLKNEKSEEKRNRVYREFIHKIRWWKTNETMKFTFDMIV